ncbi:5-formyltetrahydrofolate cyclo-ligase [Leucobacter sp. GX24907]
MDEGAYEKRRVRTAVRTRRSARSVLQQSEAGTDLARHLSRLMSETGSRSVTCYLPVRGEPDTRPFLDWAQDQGLNVLLPSSLDDGRLEWRRSRGETVPGLFGIPEPVGDPEPPSAISAVDLMLIPACAVDTSGTRLGWGRGYFDRILSALPASGRPAVYAVVYDDELLPSLPAEPHDVPVDGAVTPSGVVHFSADGNGTIDSSANEYGVDQYGVNDASDVVARTQTAPFRFEEEPVPAPGAGASEQ